ncbi:MAG: c-type cytochrome biogenesis protein CcmI [Rhizobiaceae bacterium]|nr:c-type cytochrome biogenesis protein CcmI [Rhizobiaceae bacterium]
MLFWLAAAALTLVASLAVLLPLSRQPRADADRQDVAVYRDQLAELDREAARGLIGPTEVEEARAEIGRRMIRADAATSRAAAPPRNWARVLATAAVLAVPLVGWGVYAVLGSPDLPSQPLSARLAKCQAGATVEELVGCAEAHLAANPEDGKGWDVLAPIYMRMGRSAEAAQAFANAIRLEGSTALRESGLGEALADAADGSVTPQAQDAFARALAIEPGFPKAVYYLAIASFQQGRADEAMAAWRKLAADAAPDSPWRTAANEAIAEAERRTAAAADQPGPTTQDVEAAKQMAPADQQAMIETMVASLDEKLRQNPNDPEGWLRLVRSYVVLERKDAAREAVVRAVAALGKDSDAARQVNELAASLGVTTTE